MTLRSYQHKVEFGVLYECQLERTLLQKIQLNPSIFIDSGSVDVYGSDSAIKPASLASMILNTDSTAVMGIQTFDNVPRYLAFKQNVGNTTEIIVSGIKVTALGSIL